MKSFKIERILVLDPGSTTGYCGATVEGSWLQVGDQRLWNSPPRVTVELGELDTLTELHTLWHEFNPTLLLYERFTTYTLEAEIHAALIPTGAALLLAELAQIPMISQMPATRKTAWTRWPTLANRFSGGSNRITRSNEKHSGSALAHFLMYAHKIMCIQNLDSILEVVV